MSLTPDQIESIKQEAERLEKWAGNIYFDYSPHIVRLSPSYGMVQVVLLLFKEMSDVAEKIRWDYKTLDQLFYDVCNLSREPITNDNDRIKLQVLGDYAIGCAYRIANDLRYIAKVAELKEELKPKPSDIKNST